MGRPRCIIAEDVAPTAVGMTQLLAPDLDVVAIVDDFSTLMASVERLQPDVVLLDPGLPHICRLEAAEKFALSYPAVPFVIWSAAYDTLYGIWCLAAGARAVVPKTASDEQIRTWLTDAAEGRRTVSPEQAQWVVDRFGASERRLDVESGRILNSVAEGETEFPINDYERLDYVFSTELRGLWLSPRHRRLVVSLALHRTRDRAAKWLDVKRTTFDSYVNEIRPRLFPLRPGLDSDSDRVAFWALETHASCLLARASHEAAAMFVGENQAPAEDVSAQE